MVWATSLLASGWPKCRFLGKKQHPGVVFVWIMFLCHNSTGTSGCSGGRAKLTSHQHQDNWKDFFIICIWGHIPKPNWDQAGETKVERSAVATLKPTFNLELTIFCCFYTLRPSVDLCVISAFKTIKHIWRPLKNIDWQIGEISKIHFVLKFSYHHQIFTIFILVVELRKSDTSIQS